MASAVHFPALIYMIYSSNCDNVKEIRMAALFWPEVNRVGGGLQVVKGVCQV